MGTFGLLRRIALIASAAALCNVSSAAAAQGEPYRCHEFQGSDVLLVGDSHTRLPQCTGSYPDWDVDARPGRDSTQGLRVVKRFLMPRHRIVVFDLGSNDALGTTPYRSNLKRLWNLLGGKRRLVLVTAFVRSDNGGNRADEVNAETKRFAVRHQKRVSVIDWGQYVSSHLSVLGPDGLHFTLPGYRRRVRMVLRGVAKVEMSLH